MVVCKRPFPGKKSAGMIPCRFWKIVARSIWQGLWARTVPVRSQILSCFAVNFWQLHVPPNEFWKNPQGTCPAYFSPWVCLFVSWLSPPLRDALGEAQHVGTSLSLFLSWHGSYFVHDIPPLIFRWTPTLAWSQVFGFLVCYAATQLALQLHQDHIQVVRSDKVVRGLPTESNGTPAMLLGFEDIRIRRYTNNRGRKQNIGIIIILCI